jgi:hypothetical protein
MYNLIFCWTTDLGRKRKWFKLDEALEALSNNKRVQLDYLQHLRPNHKVEEAVWSEPLNVTNSSLTLSVLLTYRNLQVKLIIDR